MKRFVKCRKQLSNEQARSRIANLQQVMTAHHDNIIYWIPKIGKPLEFIDIFILGTDKLKTPEEFIKMSNDEMNFLMLKIEDYKRFLTEPYKSFIF